MDGPTVSATLPPTNMEVPLGSFSRKVVCAKFMFVGVTYVAAVMPEEDETMEAQAYSPVQRGTAGFPCVPSHSSLLRLLPATHKKGQDSRVLHHLQHRPQLRMQLHLLTDRRLFENGPLSVISK